MFERMRIVLVSPSGPANVGSVCRAMANMGLSDLVMVSPRCTLDADDAIAYAAHGRHVLDGARVVDSISAALNGCIRTYATSSKLGLYRRQAAITPRVAAREAVELAANGPVAFAFGREDYGLKDRELLSFDRIVTIPADETYPVMNLAVSAAIVSYELRQALQEHAGAEELPTRIDHGPAPNEAKEILFEKLFDALDRIGFFFGPNPERLCYPLRHLFGRLSMSRNEVDILIGMASQIRWYVDRHPPDAARWPKPPTPPADCDERPKPG